MEISKIIGIVLYLTILLLIGVVASRRMKDVKDYFAAGKSLGFLSVAFSARATGESAWLLLGLTGMGAMYGFKAFWVVGGEVLGVMGAWLLLSRRFKLLTDKYDSVTIPDYLESRFRDKKQHVRLVSSFVLIVFVTIYVSAQIDATGQAFEDFLGWNYFVGITVGFTVVTLYITTGGFLAVAWSDVFQGALMFVGLVVLPVVAIISIGGVSKLCYSLYEIDPNLLSLTNGQGPTLMSIASICSLTLIGLGFLGSPQIFVRFIALKDESEIEKGAWVAFIWTLLADSGAVFIGMAGRVIFEDPSLGFDVLSDKEGVLPALVEYSFSPLIVGIYIAIVLSAIMSTVDSLLVLASSAVVRDYYQKVRNPTIADDALIGLSRKVTVALSLLGLCLTLLIAFNTEERSIFWFVIFGWSGISATFCPMMILSLFWPRFNSTGAIGAMVAGFLGVPIFKFLVPSLPVVGKYFAELGELPPSFLLSFVVAIVVSLLTSKPEEYEEIKRELSEIKSKKLIREKKGE
jgi:sodium/proline symporter